MYAGAEQDPYLRLKSRRHITSVGSEDLMARLRMEGHGFDGLKQEIDAARRRRQKEDCKYLLQTYLSYQPPGHS